jgi:hypothetical protein
MAYGNAQLLGSGINASLGQQDFSGYERAGQVWGKTITNMGEQIGDAIKTSKENERRIKKAEQMAKSIRDAIPELSEMGNNALAELANPDLTTNQKLAIAAGIEDSLKIGVLGLEQNRANAMLKMQQDEFNAKLNAPTSISAPATKEVGDGKGGTITVQWDSETGQWFPIAENVRGVNNFAANSIPLPDATPQPKQSKSFFDFAGEAIKRGLGIKEEPNPEGEDFGVLPMKDGYPNYGTFEDATRRSDGSQTVGGGIGYTPAKTETKSKPELVTLPDGTQAYGSFENGVFVPAKTAGGEIMTVKEPEMTPVQKAAAEKAKNEIIKKNNNAVSEAKEFIQSLEELEKSPGFTNLFGTNIGVPTWWAGSAGADAKRDLEQITGKAFASAIEVLRGTGPISDAEGRAVSAAYTALDSSMSEDRAKKEISKLKRKLNRLIEVSRQEAEAIAKDASFTVQSEMTDEDVDDARLQRLLNPNK